MFSDLNSTGQSADPPSRAWGSRGFNLMELMMSLGIATGIFMGMVTLFVQQGQVMQQQNELILLNRESRFGLEHLRADLQSLGSYTTPNSAIDPLVCVKPDPVLRALSGDVSTGYVAAAQYNPHVKPVSLTLFGSMDVKTRYKTASIDGSKVLLLDDGTLPVSQEDFEAVFAVGRYLRISGANGQMMFYPITAANQGDRSVTVGSVIQRVGNGITCGYSGLGNNYDIDVQNFVRYRITADVRPGAPTDGGGAALQSLLVRERLAVDGTTVLGQLVLVENAVDLQLYDIGMDFDSSAEVVKLKVLPLTEDVIQANGEGFLGSTTSAHPEALRFLTVKLSVRSQWPQRDLLHRKRDVSWQPLQTWQLPGENDGAHPVVTAATRVALPTLVSRNM